MLYSRQSINKKKLKSRDLVWSTVIRLPSKFPVDANIVEVKIIRTCIDAYDYITYRGTAGYGLAHGAPDDRKSTI